MYMYMYTKAHLLSLYVDLSIFINSNFGGFVVSQEMTESLMA